MIEFDESEMNHSTVSESTLRALFSFSDLIGYIHHDLLYAGDQYIRLDYSNPRGDIQTRPITCSVRGGNVCAAQNEGSKEEDAPIHPVGIGL